MALLARLPAGCPGGPLCIFPKRCRLLLRVPRGENASGSASITKQSGEKQGLGMSHPQPLCNLSLDASPPHPAGSEAALGSPQEGRGARLSTRGDPGKAAAGSMGLAERGRGTPSPAAGTPGSRGGLTHWDSPRCSSCGVHDPCCSPGSPPRLRNSLGRLGQPHRGGLGASPTQSPKSRCCCRRCGESLPLACRQDMLPVSDALPPLLKPGRRTRRQANHTHPGTFPWPGRLAQAPRATSFLHPAQGQLSTGEPGISVYNWL